MSLYVFWKTYRKRYTKFCDEELEASTLETVLGIQIDHNLSFEDHIKTLCFKAAKKVNALKSIGNFTGYSKRNPLFHLIKKSQFSYCPLVWMFCSKRSNNLIMITKEL